VSYFLSEHLPKYGFPSPATWEWVFFPIISRQSQRHVPLHELRLWNNAYSIGSTTDNFMGNPQSPTLWWDLIVGRGPYYRDRFDHIWEIVPVPSHFTAASNLFDIFVENRDKLHSNLLFASLLDRVTPARLHHKISCFASTPITFKPICL